MVSAMSDDDDVKDVKTKADFSSQGLGSPKMLKKDVVSQKHIYCLLRSDGLFLG